MPTWRFYRLGQLKIEYKQLPGTLWETIITDLTSNMIKVRSNNRSLLLQGWLGLRYHWKDMNKDLRLSLLNAATEQWKTDDVERKQATTLLYLGDLQMHKHLKVDSMTKLLDRVAVSCMNYEAAGVVNILLG